MPPRSSDECNDTQEQLTGSSTTRNYERMESNSKISDEDYFEGGTKGSIRWKLGTYKTLQPFAIYIFIMWIYKLLVEKPYEPVNIPMSRKFLMQVNEYLILLFGVLYITFSLVWGPNMMKRRKPIHLKKGGMQGWFYCFGFLEHDPTIREKPCNLFCEPEDRSNSPFNQKAADVCYLYFWAKALDWCDTLFLVLLKKWSHISVLHVFHHMGMFLAAYGFNKYVASGTFTIVGFLNSFVHVILYSYYFLAACGPSVRKYLWWKKYITVIQMVQFIIIAIFGCIVIYNNCELHKHAKVNLVIYAMGFLALFLDFYFHEYNRKSKGKNENNISNGIDAKDETMDNGIKKKEN